MAQQHYMESKRKNQIHQHHQPKIHQKRPPVFLSCTIKLVVWLIGSLIFVYLGVLWSFFFSSATPTTAISSPSAPSPFSSSVPSSKTQIKSTIATRTTTSPTKTSKTITIGVASTVTSCSGEPFVDGAAVLKHSLDLLTSPQNNDNDFSSRHDRKKLSKYDFQMYILYHPNAAECVRPLEDLGFTLLERDTPVKVEEIAKDNPESFLRERISVNGCCGELELIKLEAFKLIQHPVVIHIDLDTLILKPLDGLIDLMIQHNNDNPDHPVETRSSKLLSSSTQNLLPIMWPEKPLPEQVSLLFTKDYNVVAPKRHDKPYQGGFFMIKPSIETYNEFVDIVRKGDYHSKKGWGSKVGPFYGGMTVQGLLPYYYEYIKPGQSVELNRCIVNNMSDKPRLEDPARNFSRCRTNEETCEDCRERPADDVMSFHFTICQKPWNCLKYKPEGQINRAGLLCREMNRRWYEYRSRLEVSWGRNGTGTGAFLKDHYRGYCHSSGQNGYQTISRPYGRPIIGTP